MSRYWVPLSERCARRGRECRQNDQRAFERFMQEHNERFAQREAEQAREEMENEHEESCGDH